MDQQIKSQMKYRCNGKWIMNGSKYIKVGSKTCSTARSADQKLDQKQINRSKDEWNLDGIVIGFKWNLLHLNWIKILFHELMMTNAF